MSDRPSPSAVVWTAHFAPHVGGVERYTQCLWGRMASRGWDVTVVTADAESAPRTERVDDLTVVRLPSWNVLEGRVPIPRPSRPQRDLLRTLVARPPDVFVSNTRFFPTSVLAARMARRTRRPLLHIDHGSDYVQLGRPLVDRLTRAYDRRVGGWVLRCATTRCGVSRSIVDFLRREFAVDDACVLSNGVAVDGWDTTDTDYRRRLGLEPDDVLVVFAGRLIEAKGVADMLHALGLLETESRIHLAVAGAGPLADAVAAYERRDPRVHLLGRLRPEQMHDLLLATDIFAHPSTYPEGLPTVLLEAAAAGAAIVATPMGGTSEIVEDGVSGVLVPPHDAVALAAALSALADAPALRERYRAAARNTIEEQFDWELIADQLEQLLATLLARPVAAASAA
jgi:glycosyltransferase involved in cell wall biosynthesis